MKKILITGSSGLIGKATIDKLLSSSINCEIFAFSSKPMYSTNKKLHYYFNAEFEQIIKKYSFDFLLQLAFPRNVKENEWADGFKFVTDVLFLAKKYDVKSVINVSSQSIYGWHRKRCSRELDSVYLNSPYTTGKYFVELLVNQLFSDVPHTNIRLSTVIGPTTKERVPNKLFSQIVKNEILNIKGGKQIFSFLDVRDAASGLVCLITHDRIWRECYNLGTSEHATLLEIANIAVKIGKKYGYESDIIVEPNEIILNNMLDVKAMQEDFKWEARYTLGESMEYIFRQSYFRPK